jgi:hydroxymethylglutaryl-CoA synthase
MVVKAFTHLWGKHSSGNVQEQFLAKVAPTLTLNVELGNIYTGSLYLGLICLSHLPNVGQQTVGLFSYGSGLAATFLAGRFVRDPALLARGHQVFETLKRRVWLSPEDYQRVMDERERMFGQNKVRPRLDRRLCFEGIFYLEEVDEKFVRRYRFLEQEARL